MDVVLIGNSHPAIAIGDPDEDGNVRVAVFSHEQYVSKSDLYAVDGGPQPFADKKAADAPAPQQAQFGGGDGQQAQSVGDPLANAQTQPVDGAGA